MTAARLARHLGNSLLDFAAVASYPIALVGFAMVRLAERLGDKE